MVSPCRNLGYEGGFPLLLAGFSKVCISPPIGAPLAGFAARQGMCEGVHDDLFARAFVIEKDGKAVAFVSLDVLAVSSEFVGRVRENIERRTGIKRDAVMIAATHTHAGPVTIRTFFNPDGSLDDGYMNSLEKTVEDSVAEAFAEKLPARIGVGTGYVCGIGVNRRAAEKQPIDEEIGIIKVEDSQGNTRGVFVNYACHPTVLGSNNLLATGDFPHFTIEKIEQATGGFAMFVNGTQGNISMGHSSELSAIGIITPGRTFEKAAELGYKLADATLDALPDIQTKDSLELSVVSSSVNFPLKNLPEIEEAEQNFREIEESFSRLSQSKVAPELLMKGKSQLLYASITNFYAKETAHLDGHLPVEIQAVRIGDAVFLAVPAEVFVEIGLELKRRAPRKTYIVGIANGYIGYFPTQTAYAEGGYEVVSSKIAPSSETIFYQEVLKLEERLFTETVYIS